MQLFLIEVLMHARRSDFMVEFKEAYKIANKFFLENDYACVDEAKETSDRWLFAPKCKKTCYGVSYVCVPKKGDEPYLFNITDAMALDMWKKAKVVSV